MECPIYNEGDRAHLVGVHLKFSSLELENEAHEKRRCHLTGLWLVNLPPPTSLPQN